MIFDLIRLVLVSKAQTSFFETRADDGSELSRELWLRVVFEQRIDFIYRKQFFSYVPTRGPDDRLLYGLVGRRLRVVENLSPDDAFGRIERDAWVASIVVIDPTHHSDGQKAGVESKPDNVRPLPLIQALCEHANLNLYGPYLIEANGISDAKSFWDFEDQNKGQIVSVSFELTVPNMFGIRDKIDKDMEELRDNEKAVSAVVTLKNPNGLQLDTDRVRQTVAYTVEGGGAIKARSRTRTYNSTKKIKTVEVFAPNDLESDTLFGMIASAAERIFRGE